MRLGPAVGWFTTEKLMRAWQMLAVHAGGDAMKAKTFIEQAERDAKLIDALLLARYMLVIHDGKHCTAEGETWRLDFRPELDEINSFVPALGT